MKTIELKIADITRNGVTQSISTKQILKDCVDFVAPETHGLNISGQKKRLRLMDIIDNVKPEDKSLEMEDADFEALHTCFKQMRWGLVHPLILEVDEQLTDISRGKKEKEAISEQ